MTEKLTSVEQEDERRADAFYESLRPSPTRSNPPEKASAQAFYDRAQKPAPKPTDHDIYRQAGRPKADVPGSQVQEDEAGKKFYDGAREEPEDEPEPKATAAATDEELTAQAAEWTAEAVEEHGQDAIDHAREMLDEHGDDELFQVLEYTGLAWHPSLVRFAVKLARRTS